MSGERWNSNLHAFEKLLECIPPGAMRGLDAGCGEGESARRLRRRVPRVVGLDADALSIEHARRGGDDIDYLVGDLLTGDVAEDSFDVVSAVAVLHHLDHRLALQRLSRLLRPGGVLLVVGLARSRSVADFTRDAIDSVAFRRHSLFRGVWETSSPKVWPPPLTYAGARQASMEALPGVRFNRVTFFRYALTWTRPAG